VLPRESARVTSGVSRIDSGRGKCLLLNNHNGIILLWAICLCVVLFIVHLHNYLDIYYEETT